MSDYQKLLEDYVEWQTKAMPLCTKESQFLKVEEELKEFLESNSIEEFVDVVMSNVVLGARFNSLVSFMVNNSLPYNDFDDEELREKFIEKFEINKKREWVFNERTKTYHHEITWEELIEWAKDFCQKRGVKFTVGRGCFYVDDIYCLNECGNIEKRVFIVEENFNFIEKRVFIVEENFNFVEMKSWIEEMWRVG